MLINYNSIFSKELLDFLKNKFQPKLTTLLKSLYKKNTLGFIKNILHKDGIWLCQLMTAKPMLDSNDLGNIIHEHIEYYTYKSLVNLMERHDLEIYRVNENDINGKYI